MKVERELPSREAYDLLELVTDVADKELGPRAAEFEESGRFPREVFGLLGEVGLLTLPFGEDVGGGGQPYTVYLQVLEEIAARWAAVAVGMSVHTLSCHPVTTFGTEAQQAELLPRMLSGEALGAYSLSEAHAGSDPGALRGRRTSAARLDRTGHQSLGHTRRSGRLLHRVPADLP